MVWFAVASGGALGALLRYAMITGVQGLMPKAQFPYGVLLVNVLGSFVLGGLFIYLQDKPFSQEAYKLALTVGLLGAMTTFSTFALDSAQLLLAGDWLRASLNILCNVSLSIAAIFAAFFIYKSLH